MKTPEANIRTGKLLITLLRMAIGWHFLYEGLTKLLDPAWSAYGYLARSTGFLAPLYQLLAANSTVLGIVDILNIYGLILIGLALFVGAFTRWAAIAGALLLMLYYFAYPPFGASLFSSPEGQPYIVNKNLIEALALMFFVFSRERGYGLDALAGLLPFSSRGSSAGIGTPEPVTVPSRREVVKNLLSLPVLGALGLGAFRMKNRMGADVLSGATIQVSKTSLNDLKGVLPTGKIGPHNISRLVLGGNLIGGWAHSRDLIYVPSLFKAYNTEEKIYETLMLAENAGINTINIGNVSNPLMAKYKKITGSKIQVISQVAPNMETGDYFEQINISLDNGADIMQVQGNWCDWLVRDNKLEVIEAMLEKIRSHGMVAGLGAHTVDSLIRCEEAGIIPDYYMQTMHHDQYWSAHPRENRVPFEVDGEKFLDHNRFHDNIFCLFPDRTAEFVNRTTVPVMGFKVLAAGAIAPEDGFRWAFENGADFVCVGMFDFQIVDDVNITIDILGQLGKRQRDWYA
jgi:uncharacterized membrane protein YphA (DoxX/SURF4 family)